MVPWVCVCLAHVLWRTPNHGKPPWPQLTSSATMAAFSLRLIRAPAAGAGVGAASNSFSPSITSSGRIGAAVGAGNDVWEAAAAASRAALDSAASASASASTGMVLDRTSLP